MKLKATFLLLGLLFAGDCMALYSYQLSWENPSSHQYEINLSTSPSEGESTEFRLPAWRPGRYLIQDYAAAVSGFEAADENGEGLDFERIQGNAWRVKNPPSGEIFIRYYCYANTMDAGSSVLNREMAYFNGSNIFMYVKDRLDEGCTLRLSSLDKNWKAATALQKTGPQTYKAENFHELIDCPSVFSPDLKTLSEEIDGVSYYYHFQGQFGGDTDTELAFKQDLKKIIQAQTSIFPEAPFEEYHFIYILLPYNMRHAVEHSRSACFTLPQTVAESPRSLRGLHGITSHEFWHVWNVKRIRPAAMWPYRYEGPAWTGLHWFTEGVTDYMANLFLVRAGLREPEEFYKILSNNIASLENSYAYSAVSPSESSFETWLSPSSYHDPHRRTSYYASGTRIGFLLDMKMRQSTEGKKGLDDLFRYLYTNYYKQGKGVPENGILLAAERVTGVSFEDFFKKYVDGRETIPYDNFLKDAGLNLSISPKEGGDWKKVGIDRTQEASIGLYVQSVVPGSDAAKAGIGDGDILLEINGQEATRIDAAGIFDNLQKGKEIKVKVFALPEPYATQIKYSGKNDPMDYSIEEGKSGASFRKAWLGR